MAEIELNSDNICIELQSSERKDRQSALNKLLQYCENEHTNVDDITILYDKTYLYILKCYSDKYESCRELSCSVVSQFLPFLPKNDYYLQYIITTIAGRIGQKETIEPSEEMRLMYVCQLNLLINKFRESEDSGDPIFKSYNEIIDILLKTLGDDYPAVQKETCSCISALAEASSSFHYRAEALAKPLFPIMHHKHSSNRIAAIKALGSVCLYINSNQECILEIIHEITRLLMDPMPVVRRECGRTGCKLLLELRDRYSFFDKILPLVLCCLNDESLEIREDIDQLWIKCGQQYFEENETELYKLELTEGSPHIYPENIKRPSLACRSIVARSLKMIKPILREISDWKEEVRLHSLKLLWQVILHAEDKLNSEFKEIFPVLCRACADSEEIVSREALKVAEILGILTEYENWFQIAVTYLCKNPKLGCLKCFCSIYTASKSDCLEDCKKLALILSGSDFSHSLNVEFQKYLLNLTDIILEVSLNHNTKIENEMVNLTLLESNNFEQNIYHILIKVMAISYEEHERSIYEKGERILLKIAKNKGNENLMILHSKFLNSVFDTFALDTNIDENSESILLLHGVICICQFQIAYLSSVMKCVQTVIEFGTPEAKIKIFSAISIAMLSWNESMATDLEKSISNLKQFVNELILPNLIWKVGASAESLRAMATAILCSMSQGAVEESKVIFPELASHFPALVEDNNVATRVFALRCLLNFGCIKLEDLRPLGFSVLQRLDDPSSEVREWAARTISKLCLDQSQESDVDLGLIKQIFSTLFIHLGGPEIKLKNAIKESLVLMGKQYQQIFSNACEEAIVMFANKDEINELKLKVFNI